MGGGVFHAKGWWPKSSCSPSKVCLSLASKRGIPDIPGILPGCPGPLGVFKKFVQKKFVRIFRSLKVLVNPFWFKTACEMPIALEFVEKEKPTNMDSLVGLSQEWVES